MKEPLKNMESSEQKRGEIVRKLCEDNGFLGRFNELFVDACSARDGVSRDTLFSMIEHSKLLN